jgi:hypothetical protein
VKWSYVTNQKLVVKNDTNLPKISHWPVSLGGITLRGAAIARARGVRNLDIESHWDLQSMTYQNSHSLQVHVDSVRVGVISHVVGLHKKKTIC